MLFIYKEVLEWDDLSHDLGQTGKSGLPSVKRGRLATVGEIDAALERFAVRRPSSSVWLWVSSVTCSHWRRD